MVANNDFNVFLTNLGAFESGIDATQAYSGNQLDWLMVFDPDKGGVDRNTVDLSNPDDLAMLQYHVHNTLGFLGKYQFGEPLLIDLGYYSPAPTGFYGSTATNEWQGTWTGKNGVTSKEEFMGIAQETALREAFAMNMTIIEQRLAQASKTIDDYLGQEFNFTFRGEEKLGVISMSGILASAHLQGPGGVANLLLNGAVSHDEYGTNILSYMGEFGGYDTPFGSAVDDSLAGSDYSETFVGGAGLNEIETGGGQDKIVIANNVGGVDRVVDFDLGNDVISLQNFSGVSFAGLSVVDRQGDAVITLPNGQQVILEGVLASSIGAEQFVQGNVVLGWNYNGGDAVIENFNPTHDLIDLNYAFGLNNLNLYEENGSAVVEIVDNNQRFILKDVPLAELSAFHFFKAPVGFAEAFFGDGLPVSPPIDSAPDDPVIDDPVVPPVDEQPDPVPDPVEPTTDGTYSFTWNWGADEVINNFDPAADVINLQSFWTSYAGFELYDNASGDAVIDLSNLNNQTITLLGISVGQLGEQHFAGVTGQFNEVLGESIVPPIDDLVDDGPDEDPLPDDGFASESSMHAFTWLWGSESVVDNFDVNTDVIDLQAFWTDYDSFTIRANALGDTIIDLTDLNSQTIKLVGVAVEELSAANIHGVNGDFAAALDLSEPEPGTDLPEEIAGLASQEVISFTWNWGNHAVVEDFDVNEDAIDLQAFWIEQDQAPVFNNSDSHAVIDLMAINNQTITLVGVSAEQLDEGNLLF